eukprot:g11898.t1
MAYFIGNGSVTIGGGSLGRTEQLPSLKLLCVDLCARHLDRLSDLGDLPTEVFIDLLKRAKEKATPELVKRLQDINERLWCEEVDIAFWKQAVEGHILRRTVPAPGPVMVSRVNEHKERLDVLQALIAPSSAARGAETLIGKTVSLYRKSADPKIAATATSLVRRWKEAAALAALAVAAATAAATAAEGGGGGAATGGERRPAEEKQRAVEEGFTCRTWESLYQHLEMLRAEKVRTSSKRAREAREREELKRPKMIVGKSRGEDFTRKTGRVSGKLSAPSFFAPPSPASSFSSGPGPSSLSTPKTPKRKPLTSPSSSSSSRSGGGKGGGSCGGKGSGGGGGRSKGGSVVGVVKKPKKGDHYSSGVTTVAELRRKVVSDQRLIASPELSG